MQGYYGRPKESAACFIRNPFAAGREEKLYCTGDWVTLDEKGNYLFVGRKDHMIKTRGYRVELGEIEAVMVAHPAVDEAVALAIPDEEIGNTIRAIVTLRIGVRLTSPELKRHCAEKLLPYMVPEELSFGIRYPEPATGKSIGNVSSKRYWRPAIETIFLAGAPVTCLPQMRNIAGGVRSCV